MLKIEFFHDVICSFCFPMSYRMRQLQKMFPNIKIVHRSFALVQSVQDFERMFGSHEAAKDEIMSHWQQANQNDDQHRFQIDKMRQQSFLFPVSMNPLFACKAAYLVAGEDAYWDLFDALQSAFFVEARNVQENSVIEDCVKQVGLNLEEWKEYYQNNETLDKVREDFYIAKQYGVNSVPSLIINEKYIINGALPLDVLVESIQKISKQEDISVQAESCCLVDDKVECS